MTREVDRLVGQVGGLGGSLGREGEGRNQLQAGAVRWRGASTQKREKIPAQ